MSLGIFWLLASLRGQSASAYEDTSHLPSQVSPESRHAVINLHDSLPGETKSSLSPSPVCEDREEINVRERQTDHSLTSDGTMSSLKNVSVLAEIMRVSKTFLQLSHLAHHHGIPAIVAAKGLRYSHLMRARTQAQFTAAAPLEAAGKQM